MSEGNGVVPKCSSRNKDEMYALTNGNGAVGNMNNCSRSSYMHSPRSRDSARDRTRDVCVEYSSVSNTATVKEMSSSQQIIYVYCSPKLKHAIVAIWKVILFSYCIGVPIIIALLYRENEYNIERLTRLNRTLQLHELRNDSRTTSSPNLERTQRDPSDVSSYTDIMRFRRSVEVNFRNNGNVENFFETYPILDGSNRASDAIFPASVDDASADDGEDGVVVDDDREASADATAVDDVSNFSEICETLSRVRRSADGTADEPEHKNVLEKSITKLRTTLNNYEQRVKSVEQTYKWLKTQTWISNPSNEDTTSKCTCNKEGRDEGECKCKSLQGMKSGVDVTMETSSTNERTEERAHCDCISHDRRTTYVRWGSVTCPLNNRTTSIYTGYMSGDGGTNYLCLPSVPKYLRRDGRANKATGNIDGLRYESTNPLFGIELKEKAVPCSLCHVTEITSSVMIPAATSCPNGWSELYSGHLVVLSGRKRGNYVCLQREGDAKAIYGSRRVITGSVEPVYTKCNILQCDSSNNYNDNKPLSCVLCGR